MKSSLIALATLLLLIWSPSAAQAQTPCGNDGPPDQRCSSSEMTTKQTTSPTVRTMSTTTATSATVTATAQAEHSGFSPFDLPSELHNTDTFFVADVGGGLDTGCTFRDQGPLVVTVRVNRVVADAADMNADGTIRNWQELVNKGVLSRFAKLEMPAYDVDFNAPIGLYFPERDHITFNGQDVGPLGADAHLTGEDSVWKLNTFRIPIEFVRFARLNPNGGAPIPGENIVQIDIDQDNIVFGENVWCTALDWVAIGFDAIAPVIMVHGNNSNGAFFSNLGFVNPFRAAKIPYDNSINMATSDIRTHGNQLGGLIKQRADAFGAKYIHIVAHSKGGLDTRDFLARRLPPELGVLSLITLATPHNGSAGANYAVSASRVSYYGILNSDNVFRTALARVAGVDAGTPNLRVNYVQNTFNPSNLRQLPLRTTVGDFSNPVAYYAFGADANLDGSHDANGPTIQSPNSQGQDEMQGVNFVIPYANYTIPIASIPGGTNTVQEIYRMMGTVKTARVGYKDVLVPGILFPRPARVRVVKEVPTDSFQLNDFLVTYNSATNIRYFTPMPREGANHASIARPDVAERIIALIRDVQRRKLK